MLATILRVSLLGVLWGAAASAQDFDPGLAGTYSIIARDPATGELGMAVQSKAFAAGNRVAGAKGGVGVIAHQAVSNPMYSYVGLPLLEAGLSPQEALDQMVRGDDGRARRQVAILDIEGRSASWTGPGCTDWKGHHCGTNYCAQGNTLAGPEVLDAMVKSFESSSGPLAERLLAALNAAQAAGGDWRGMQAAALWIVKPRSGAAGFSDRAIDIRVDDHRQPLVELRRLLNIIRSTEIISQANARLQAGELDAALERALAARDKAPDNDNAWVVLGQVYVKMNRRFDALAAVRRAIELNPANERNLPRNPNFEALYKH
jgi:uncharacterized Ntn-hydrolase superfamily protein